MGGTDSPSFNWKIPEGIHADGAKCILRIRYNLTTMDFGSDSWNVFANSNKDNSPVKTNPSSDWLGMGMNVSGPLRLNINTAQFGRTFEDRTHVFQIRKRPANLACGLRTADNCDIWNVNVRGRRGNIVQVYPSVEYDFVPPVIKAARNDYLHIQWTGSDANDQNNDGNGRTGTDRSNIVIVPSLGKNYPQSLADPLNPSVINTNLHFTDNLQKIAYMAYLNQTNCDPTTTNTNSNYNCKTLNRSPGYVNVGLVQVENMGTFNLLSTRNNAFTNREQKSTLIVSEDSASVAAAAGISASAIVMLGALGFFGLSYARRNPKSRLAQLYMIAKTDNDGSISDTDSQAGMDDEPKSWADKYPWLAPLIEWYAWHQALVLFVVFFTTCQIGAYGYGYFTYVNTNPAPYFAFAKGFGKVIDIDMGLVLIPILRNFMSYLRTTPAAEKLPLDDNINIHKWVAYSIALASVGHISMHFLDYVWLQVISYCYLERASSPRLHESLAKCIWYNWSPASFLIPNHVPGCLFAAQNLFHLRISV